MASQSSFISCPFKESEAENNRRWEGSVLKMAQGLRSAPVSVLGEKLSLLLGCSQEAGPEKGLGHMSLLWKVVSGSRSQGREKGLIRDDSLSWLLQWTRGSGPRGPRKSPRMVPVGNKGLDSVVNDVLLAGSDSWDINSSQSHTLVLKPSVKSRFKV